MEVPPDPGIGDFAYPCFSFSKVLKKPPGEIAVLFVKEIGTIEKMEVSADSGYLNFKIDYGTLASSTLPKILADKNNYAQYPARSEKIILEHTSANPNGPFHVGRARNPIIGDTLARILRKAGYPVEVQYWVNDMGKQVAILAWGVQNIDEAELPGVDRDKKDHILVRYYQEAYKRMEKDPSVEDDITALIQAYERGDKEELRKVKEPTGEILSGMTGSLEKLNIFVDRFVWESESVLDGTVEKVIEKLKTADITKEEDGAFYLDLESFDIGGKTSRFVFTRSDGTSLYTTRDLAYHSKKLSECDIAINILGEDHKLQSKQLQIALNILETPIVPDVVFYSFVSLEEGKMSTRRGQVVYLDDLMDEAVGRALEEVKTRREDLPAEKMQEIAEMVGLGSIRYNIIRVQPEKKITFRWKDALNFEGNSAPFIQYAHARACSILRKAGIDVDSLHHNTELLKEPAEEALLRNIAKLPSLVSECARARKPHLLANYAHETASLFNQFYKNCPVINAELKELRDSRLALVLASSYCLAASLDLLGIDAPEQM